MKPYFATVARGLEPVLAQELTALGATDVKPDFAGVHFSGDQALLYRVNLWSRLAFRVLVPLREFICPDRETLYREVQQIPWADHLSPGHTLAVDCTGGANTSLNHTHFSALQVKNAIVDQQRTQSGQRSSVDAQKPDLRVNLHLHQDRAVLSLDSSGESLHRRGYRTAVGIAPLKETLAAALLDLAGWQPGQVFLDPLCGAGTLPLEAGLKALRMAPGLRAHGFCNWPDFDPQLWQRLQTAAQDQELADLPAPILGSDHDPLALITARANAQRAGLAPHIPFTLTALDELEAPAPTGVLLCNPPYGERLGDAQVLGELYRTLGDIFKQRFKGWTAFILTGNRELAKQVGLRTAQRLPVYNGSLPCTLLKYELY
ncbi:class I SAM-dependent RNA methyltransferase [Candidatus Cyanaurora vandensis]|uniref:THUMP domain-containing class I SAM-dependent RNA methyltransferase n=1 Tax=Candidatus Cyanaurora vandensis TaxID=2714958 RepID=UPI00257A803A|nr:THUMP domain-containing protein [Candidatus Cyanaurora vandensis]